MLQLDSTTQQIVESEYKEIWWLFDIEDNASSPTTLYRGTSDKAWGGESYTFGVIPDSFKGITLTRDLKEIGLNTPSKVSFQLSNASDVLTADDFVGGKVTVRLVISDGSNTEEVAAWAF